MSKRSLTVGGVPEHFNLPWRLAMEAGAFRGIDASVVWREVPSGTGELMRALRAGDLDVALVLTEGAVADILNAGGCRIVKVWVASPLVWGIHVAAGSALRALADVPGTRYAISRFGSGSHLIPIVDAAARGWETDSLRFVVVNDLAGARAALAGGDADVFFWERHMTQPLVDSGEFRRIGEREVPWPAFVAAVRESTARRRGDDIRQVLDIGTATARRMRRRKSSAGYIASEFGLRLADVERWLNQVRWAGGYRRPTAALKRATKALRAQGLVEASRFDPDCLWADLTGS